MPPRLPSLSKMTPMRIALLLTALLSLLPSQNTFAQTDADSLVLKRPTKVFKAFGKRWQRNGHNYHLMIGSYTMKSWSKVDDVFSLTNMPDEKQSFNVNKNKSVNSREQGFGFGYLRDFGISISYEMISNSTSSITKEVRIGAAYSDISLGESRSRFDFTLDPYQLGIVGANYSCSLNVEIISIKADMLWNFKPFLKNKLRFYTGAGVRVSPALFSSVEYDHSETLRQFDPLSNQYEEIESSFIPKGDDLPNLSSSFHYGLQALGGIKFNASCRTTWYIEMQKALNFDTFFGAKTYVGTSTLVAIGLRKRLHYFDLVEPPKNPDLTAPPIF